MNDYVMDKERFLKEVKVDDYLPSWLYEDLIEGMNVFDCFQNGVLTIPIAYDDSAQSRRDYLSKFDILTSHGVRIVEDLGNGEIDEYYKTPLEAVVAYRNSLEIYLRGKNKNLHLRCHPHLEKNYDGTKYRVYSRLVVM